MGKLLPVSVSHLVGTDSYNAPKDKQDCDHSNEGKKQNGGDPLTQGERRATSTLISTRIEGGKYNAI